MEEFEGENLQLFLRAFFDFGGILLKDFEHRGFDDEADELFQLERLMERALFAGYAAMEVLGVERKVPVTESFSDECSR